MDWEKAIEINKIALIRIVAELIAMVGIASERLPRPVYRAVMLVLRPAESAVRRLIVIAARGVVVEPSPSRSKSKGSSTAKKGGGSTRVEFQLFDSRKNFERRRRKTGPKMVPRVTFIDINPNTPPFLRARPRYVEPAPPPDDGKVNAARLCRRLAAIKAALEDLPRQAKRLARWRARRNGMTMPKFRDPMRPGRAPGYRKRHRHEVDAVLKECHALAWYALKPDTS
jgi:hypothetical protein